jgi:hypothetical protein
MEFIDLSWVCFPDCSLVAVSQTGLPVTDDMEASKLTCLVSQSRRFQACFTLSTRQELTAFSEDCQDDQPSMHPRVSTCKGTTQRALHSHGGSPSG